MPCSLLLPLCTSVRTLGCVPCSLYSVHLAPFGSHHEMKMGGQGTVTIRTRSYSRQCYDWWFRGRHEWAGRLAALVPVTVEPHAAGAHQELAIDQLRIGASSSTPRTACNATTAFWRGPCIHACCPELWDGRCKIYELGTGGSSDPDKHQLPTSTLIAINKSHTELTPYLFP